jgi:N-acyl-D-aspartate/D-glutamate deacylase
MHDLVIRRGTVVDGTGSMPRQGDVAIDGHRIVAVGCEVGRGRREIDARGLLVAPGWVDIHTHYDGQATWDPWLAPSSWHGVTTVVMGNCGVGFAPARPDRHQWLVSLMECVEDIPSTALAEGIPWSWERFPEYLDTLAAMPRAIDIGAQVPHAAVRVYVMGERGARNMAATPEDIAEMAAIVHESLAAGALGLTTSRSVLHRAIDGEPLPGTFAATDELMGIAQTLGDLGSGVLELSSDLIPEDTELAWMEQVSARTGRPITFGVVQSDVDPAQWRRLLDATDRAVGRGARLVPQVASRPCSLLMGLQGTLHPFVTHATYREIAHLPLDERVQRMRDPGTRRRILAERLQFGDPGLASLVTAFQKLFVLGDPPDYEPAANASVAAIADRRGTSPGEVAYDLLLEREGHELLYLPFGNYSGFDFEAIREMLLHPRTVLGLTDAGAHCGFLCDASMPTFLLTHWVRDRRRGARLPLPHLVRRQTRDTAALYGLHDRGVLAPGMKADLNLIDLDALDLAVPEMVFDLPAQGRRLVQGVRGYRMTLVSGTVVFEDGEPTGALPGRLIRGRQPAPDT